MRYDAESMLFRSRLATDEAGLVNRVTPDSAGWEMISVETRRLQDAGRWRHETGPCEAALVVLSGRCTVQTNHGAFNRIGRRRNVFDGLPWALYLPRNSTFDLTSHGPVELAYCWVPTDRDGQAALITPDDVNVEIRGGHNNSRQINDIIPPGFPCDRLVCCEVYTPSGNWSSYPPHKHDTHVERDGRVVEADLEEVYCYKFDRPAGWAMQRVYTADGAIDAAMVARDGDIVLVPEGYHPVSTGYGYDCYYLNFLAGSAQTLAATDDPEHSWVKETWTAQDPRLPMVSKADDGDVHERNG
jgi:5-deoxy-glucuronate isomerase